MTVEHVVLWKDGPDGLVWYDPDEVPWFIDKESTGSAWRINYKGEITLLKRCSVNQLRRWLLRDWERISDGTTNVGA